MPDTPKSRIAKGRLTRRLGLATLLCAMLLMPENWPAVPFLGVTFAYADDDDGGDDDGGGGRSASRSDRSERVRVGRGLFRFLERRPPSRARKRVARLPAQPRMPSLLAQASDEIIAIGLTVEQAAELAGSGFAVVERQPLAALGAEVVKLRIPSSIGLEAAREQVRAAAPGAAVDFNHYYRPGSEEMSCEGRHCMAPTLIGWPVTGTASCSGSGLRIGLIDTAINPDHAVFSRGQVEVVRVSKDTLPESGRQHGTAVAALLVGDAGSRTPGLLPAALLVAVDAFHRGSGQDDRADAYDLARAIDTLAAKDVNVVNMSLSGPANATLERVVSRAAAGKLVLVGAAGNAGPRAAPLYPAAYADVIAVTAVDRRKRTYRRAAQGDHIDLAAPGVDVWTAASISGGRSKTGTSFAAPFVTAAAALAGADGQSSVAEIHALLAETAEDLGEPGKDPIFGWGLLNARSLCERDASEGRPATAP